MDRPSLSANPAAKRTRQRGQNLASLAAEARGAQRKRAEGWLESEHEGRGFVLCENGGMF